MHLLLARLGPRDPCRSWAEEVTKAAARAASLTRQLLAFSRKQVLQPRVFSLNVVLRDVEKMLRRLIGEDVELIPEYSPLDPRVRADPRQIEQVLMNLIVNARDAMPKGGTCRIRSGIIGDQAVLFVSDTGQGMTADVREHVFEPFFTTKAAGTGLGLAMVYGIVKQSGGNISIERVPGEGTSFCLSLPAVQGEPEVRPDIPAFLPSGVATGTILLVEDDDAVRALAGEILTGAGYQVMVAGSAAEAEEGSRRFPGRIDLLLTDVVMPGRSGPELAERLCAGRSGLRVLFVSGYAGSTVARHVDLGTSFEFLEKPFSPSELLDKVTEVLASGSRRGIGLS